MPIQFSQIQALCFDVDGTLRDTDDQFVFKLSAFLRPVRVLLPRRNEHDFARKLVMAMENPGTYLQGLTDRLNIDPHLVRLSEWLFSPQIRRSTPPAALISGVDEMLAVLSAHYPLAVISARSERTTLDFLDSHNLTRRFKIIVTGQTCRHTKPYPDPVLFAAAQMGVLPQACLMIGDTTVDIHAGQLAGAQTVGVLCGFGEQAELQRAGADLILSSTHLLLDSLLP